MNKTTTALVFVACAAIAALAFAAYGPGDAPAASESAAIAIAEPRPEPATSTPAAESPALDFEPERDAPVGESVSRLKADAAPVTAADVDDASSKPVTVRTSSYYPFAEPTDYYVLPGERVGLRGSGFAPNERLSIETADGAQSASFSARADGTFSLASIMTVPFSYADSTRRFVIRTTESAYDIPFTLTFGTYYPQIEPSDYYVANGASVNIAGRGFAPNEEVAVTVDGTAVAAARADERGSISVRFGVPMSAAKTFVVTATGGSSNTSSSRTMTRM